MGNFDDAVRHLRRFVCPACKRDESIVRRGANWFCESCSHVWFAYTEHDKVELKINRIANDEEPD